MISFRENGRIRYAVIMVAILGGSFLLASSPGTYATETPLFGSCDIPYGGMEASWDDITDGAMYYVERGGYVEIDIKNVGKTNGVETLLAGSGLVTNLVTKKIYGNLQGTAVLVMGNKSASIFMVDSGGKDLPVFGKMTDIYPSEVVPNGTERLMLTSIPSYIDEVRGLPEGLSIESGEGNIVSLTGSTDMTEDCTVEVSYRATDGTAHTESFKVLSKGSYSIIYDADGGILTKNADTVVYGGDLTLPSVERDGYMFGGWYDGDRFAGMDGDVIGVSGDMVLRASWTSADASDGTGEGWLPVILIVIGVILAIIAFLTGAYVIGLPAAVCIAVGLLTRFGFLGF